MNARRRSFLAAAAPNRARTARTTTADFMLGGGGGEDKGQTRARERLSSLFCATTTHPNYALNSLPPQTQIAFDSPTPQCAVAELQKAVGRRRRRIAAGPPFLPCLSVSFFFFFLSVKATATATAAAAAATATRTSNSTFNGPNPNPTHRASRRRPWPHTPLNKQQSSGRSRA